MNAFVSMVLHELLPALGQALATALAAAAIIGYSYTRHKARYQGEQPFPWRKCVLTILLAGYLGILGYATISRLSGMGASGFSFHLFRAWRDAWNTFSVTAWLNVLLNIAMMIPLGILVPLLFPRCQKWYFILLVSLLTSLYIETLQLSSGRGIFDVDDIFNNTLGTMLGYFLLMAALSLKDKRFKSTAGYAALVLLPLLVIADIFVTYDAQKYGNLPDSPTHRIDTSHIQWHPDCALPDVPDTVSIYRLDPPTQAESDALRDTFEEALKVEFERTDYYDESIMYMDQQGDDPFAHFLTVQRIDGSYEYSCLPAAYSAPPLSPAGTDRQTIENLLSGFSISVPEQAEFSYLHSGIHVFTADQIITGSSLVDGKLSCVYDESGILTKINHAMIRYTYHGEEPILTPQAAWERLCRGDFRDVSGAFNRQDPQVVTVTGCSLSFQPDTKGFLQPVYLFELTLDSGASITVMIPAM